MTPIHVMMFAKAPVPGQVKTRMHPGLSYELAARLHRAFLGDLSQTLERWTTKSGSSWSLHAAGDLEHPVFEKLRADGVTVIEQGTGGLGERLGAATRWASGQGARKVLLIGSDSPTLQDAHLTEALRGLEACDTTIGPSFDGGYYVVGLDSHSPEIFEDVAWSDARTCHSQVTRIHSMGQTCHFLPYWYDVDRLEDVQLLADHLCDHLAHQQPGQYGETLDVLRQIGALGRIDLALDASTSPTHR